MNWARAMRIAKKELTLFFSSPIGYLFLGSYLAVTLFAFYWGEAFFARNIADVRPMFEWLPVLLVFLCAALTMRMWSEERRSGTLEFVATVPVSTWSFVAGKYLACLILLAIALALTLPLPITVSLVANLDWGPVLAGYLAAMLLGGAYLAIGLFVSARSDNQIVSLIVATLACGAFYLIGNPLLTDLVGTNAAEWLRGLGSGSRFESITRGVVDLRDLYFYVSIIGVFLALGVYSLEASRWAPDGDRARHSRWRIGTALVVANLLVANVWLASMTGLRMDVTEGRLYSISDATRSYLGQLREPLLVRGYFSAKTHPLLAPLVPQMRDLLNELEVAGGGNVRVEVIDPADHPEMEEEANSKYGIRAVPFQVADRYQSSLVNSYFDVLVQYGDEYEVLGFRDLIEVKVAGESSLDVRLRNPEYDLTRSIKKVLEGFQSGGEVFDSIAEPVVFKGYISADSVLPEQLVAFRSVLDDVLADYQAHAGDKLDVEIIDPEAGDGSVAEQIATQYGFRPMAASLFDVNTFYYYLTLSAGDTVVQVPLPDDLSEDGLKRGMDAAFKRFASGYLKGVALMAPQAPPYMQPGMPQGQQYSQLFEVLSTNLNVERTQLEEGRVPAGVEALVVVDPTSLSETQVFAVDQFLMQGGTVILSAAPYGANLTQQSLYAAPRDTGLAEWLAHHGVEMAEAFVLDPQNAAFPVPVTRQAGGFSFQEIMMLDYPFFVDLRGDGLNSESAITADLPQVTMPWATPITIDAERNAARAVTTLLQSSPDAWQSASTDVMPRIDEAGLSTFVPEGETGRKTLAVMLEGEFTSYFADRENPLLVAARAEVDSAADDEAEDENEALTQVIGGVIDRSPESARLIVFASNDFLADQTLAMIGSAEGSLYANSLQLMANAVDFSLADQSLLSIRSRGHFNRTLPPLESEEQHFWEYLNYGFALLGVLAVFLIYRRRTRRANARYAGWLQEEAV